MNLNNISTKNIVKYLQQERGLTVNYYKVFECDIRFKEEGSPTERMQFAETNLEGEEFKYDNSIFYYMDKEEAQKLLGVEDNGLDFYLTKIY